MNWVVDRLQLDTYLPNILHLSYVHLHVEQFVMANIKKMAYRRREWILLGYWQSYMENYFS